MKAAGKECYERAYDFERAETPILAAFKWHQSIYVGALEQYLKFRDRVFVRLGKNDDAFLACEKGVAPGDLTQTDVVHAFERAISDFMAIR